MYKGLNLMNRVNQNHAIIEKLELENGMYLASTSIDYSYTWLRDSVYIVMPYLNKTCGRYEKTFHRILDMFREYEQKLDKLQTIKPVDQMDFPHARYDAYTVREIDTPWGHHQLDAIGAVLFGIGQGVKAGKKMIRDQKDHEIVQKLVGYLKCVEYWDSKDNGMWEEWAEVHSSSVGSVISGLQAVRDIVFVERELILNGYATLAKMFPRESNDRPVDLAQLSLVYPYKVLFAHDARIIVERVEMMLLRKSGVIRYPGDSYYALNEHEGRHHPLTYYYGYEAEWTFGLPWLALAWLELGNVDKAKMYIEWTERVMLEDGSLPELYYSGTSTPNPNTPLGWSSAMYILAKEAFIERTNTQEKSKELAAQ
jgi:GH15 family glucan-1,4-alpha-glucosidase